LPGALYRRSNKSDNHHLQKDTVNVANIKSQIKRILTNAKANERNKAVKSEVKTAVRATRTAIAAGDKVAAEAALKNATKKLDKAVSKGVLHKNNAANRKSAIAKSVASL
jgi:small subunit ribosomal protein S20